jgi:hypothetical protein
LKETTGVYHFHLIFIRGKWRRRRRRRRRKGLHG